MQVKNKWLYKKSQSSLYNRGVQPLFIKRRVIFLIIEYPHGYKYNSTSLLIHITYLHFDNFGYIFNTDYLIK